MGCSFSDLVSITGVCWNGGMTTAHLERLRRLLCALQNRIRDTVIAARKKQADRFADVAGVTAADTLYQVDRIGEAVILAWFEEFWPRGWPVELVMEGLDEESVTCPAGTPVQRTLFKGIIDPVDGTRGLMYDKRAAWVLTGVAPQRGVGTGLSDLVVAVMTELPTSKQWRADQVSAIRGGGPRGVVAHAIDLRRGTRTRFIPRRSRARNFEHGFAAFARFFPEGKALSAQIEEALWRELHPAAPAGRSPLIFDDQYISTGGQLYELLVGHDRMIADIRPVVLKKLGCTSSLTCHPYDICTALIFTEAGGIVESPVGRPLDAPLDTTSRVAWIGYANAHLAGKVRPVLRRLLRHYLG